MKIYILIFIVLLASGCASYDYSEYREATGKPRIEYLDKIPLVHLKGSEYQRGFQYGKIYPSQWDYAVKQLEKAATREINDFVFFSGLSQMTYRRYVDYVYSQAEDYVPNKYKAYIQGIADGSGLEVYQVARLVATVMVSDSSCSGFIAFGSATEDGRLIQTRNLDWGDEIMRPQEQSVILSHEPKDGYRYLSIGFIGLVGSVSGINEHGISLTEIGANSIDKTRAGTPMPLMLEEVLAKAKNLDEAFTIIADTPGTGGYNFLIGSAKEKRGLVIEKTAKLIAWHEVGSGGYRSFTNYFYDIKDFDCRADLAADNEIKRRHGFDLPPKCKSYEDRYEPQIKLMKHFKKLNIKRASVIMKTVAPKDNLHSIIYDFSNSKVYFRNKSIELSDDERAASQKPIVINLDKIWTKN